MKVSFCRNVCCLWDLLDYVLVWKKRLPQPVLFASPSQRQSGLVYLVQGGKQGGEVVALNVHSGEQETLMRVKGKI